MTLVSIIIPSFNAYSKIGKCLASLKSIDFNETDYEVIFVDDKSTDGTYEFLVEQSKIVKNWRVFQLVENSGSPSKPRNEGVKNASGKYIFYLDCDDEILPDTLKLHVKHAEKTNACIVRGSLYVNNGQKKFIMNNLPNWHDGLGKVEKISEIISKQSTTTPQLIKRELLLTHDISWPEQIKMGEDTLFLSKVLSVAHVVEYINHPTFIYNKMPTLSLSTTQSYGAKELRDHLSVWMQVQEILSNIKVDYIKLRLSVGLQSVFKSLLQRNRWDIDEALFSEFSEFVCKNRKSILEFSLNSRYMELVNALLEGNFQEFNSKCRPRLLIAGHDFKFIQPVVDQLSQYFDIQFDKWESHTNHDIQHSQDCLEWAEIIFCEWMLGNSKWYADHKKHHQKLIFRVHRQELGTNYAESIDFSKVDSIMVVSVLFFERLLERFPNIPREKLRLIPNYINVSSYDHEDNQERLYNLAMIGILPSKKNFHIGLEILQALRIKNPKYRLLIYSKQPKDLAWLTRNKEEMAYFDQCDAYIQQHNLLDYVEFMGHCDLTRSLSENKVGFVLSVSESVKDLPGFESFHLAVADGFASGAISLIKRWAGCEYIFPEQIIKETSDDIVKAILDYNDNLDKYLDDSLQGRKFITENYDVEKFITNFNRLILELF